MRLVEVPDPDRHGAIVAGVTGSIGNPETALLGRFDRRGRLRYTGRSHPLTAAQAGELAALLSPPRMPRGGAVAHPWPEPLPASRSGQLDRHRGEAERSQRPGRRTTTAAAASSVNTRPAAIRRELRRAG